MEISRGDLLRLASHVDAQASAGNDEGSTTGNRENLDEIVAEWSEGTRISGELATTLTEWLDEVTPLVDEENELEEKRLDRLIEVVSISGKRGEALELLRQRLPVFVYFSNYFRVRPRLHLRLLADRLEQNILDDDQYDRGNECLLKLLGFSARELSDLGEAPEPSEGDESGLKAYQDQLDRRSYQLNAASIRLTKSINGVWRPGPR